MHSKIIVHRWKLKGYRSIIQVKFWGGLPQELSRTYHICPSDSSKPSNCLRQINPKKTNPQSDEKVNEASLPTARPFLKHDAILLRLNFSFLWIFKRRLRWYNKFLQPLQIDAAPAASKWRNIFLRFRFFQPRLKIQNSYGISRATQHDISFHDNIFKRFIRKLFELNLCLKLTRWERIRLSTLVFSHPSFIDSCCQ